MIPRIVLDTNVLVSALRSQRGASYKILSLVGNGLFDIVLSVPLVFEYESATKRQSRQVGLTHQDIDDILDYLCSVGIHRQIYFLRNGPRKLDTAISGTFHGFRQPETGHPGFRSKLHRASVGPARCGLAGCCRT